MLQYLSTVSLLSPVALIRLKSSLQLLSLIPPFPHTDAEHEDSEVVKYWRSHGHSAQPGENQEPTVRALANLSQAKSQDELSIEFQ